MRSIDNRLCGSPRHQKGVIATLIAVIVLVATLLAAVALMRSLDTSNTIAGSLAFRQSVIQEAARAYVAAKNGGIIFTEPASESDGGSNGQGYYGGLMPSAAANKGIPDVLVAQATNTSSTPSPGIFSLLPITGSNTSTTQNYVYYVVERLCPRSSVGLAADPTLCSVPGATITGGSSANQTTDTGAPFNSGSSAGFRLSVLVIGPKNTIGYVQTVLR